VARLNWDTFPKSGSQWLSTTLELSYPEYKIIWGGHRINTLRKEENVITVIRNPKDCISSYLVFFQKENPEKALDWYCRFMQGTIEFSERIFITKFEKITTQPKLVMTEYAKKFNLSNPKNVTLKNIKTKVMKTHPEHLPQPINTTRLKANEIVLNSPLLSTALEFYNQACLKTLS
jgi:hypothetical protein